GATGAAGAPGAPGDPGAPGAPGAPGSPGFVLVGGFAGGIDNIPPLSGWVFAGPVTTLTTSDSQSIVGSGSSALRTTGPSLGADVTIRASPTGAGAPLPLDPENGGDDAFTIVTVTSTRLSYAGSATGAPGAGTWDVGMCVRNDDGTNPIDNNDFSVGY